MRRADREITDPAQLRAWIESENHLHLAMADGDQPYLVPMSYGYELSPEGKLTLYLHSAAQGRKLSILSRNPRVCFEISRQARLLPDEIPCRWTTAYWSVVGSGRAVFLKDRAEKARALEALVRHLGHRGEMAMDAHVLDRVTVLRVDVAEYVGKSNLGVTE
jgi:nitroimidazol reductase NimA-like FMN-containing flavoprotein (pyridoxamine 5'-phosphate oxidase superfamily)